MVTWHVMSELMSEIADLLERVANGQHVAPEEARSIKAHLDATTAHAARLGVGAVPDSPVVEKDVEPKTNDPARVENGQVFLDEAAPDAQRRIRAVGLYIRHYYERKPLAECWLELNPHTKAKKREYMGSMASVELRWLQRTYPLDVQSALEAHGLGLANLLESIAELKNRTTPLKTGVRKELDDKGRVVGESIEYTDAPDNRALATGIQQQMVLHGYGPGADRGKGPRAADTPEPEEYEELPTTMEEAIALGRPITFIEHPEEITQEEWEAEWEAYKKEREKLLPPEDARY